MPRKPVSVENPYREIRVIPVIGIGEVVSGDSVADLIVDALALGGRRLQEGDILVIKHKIVAKAEGRSVALDTIQPSDSARRFAQHNGADAQVVELALREAKRVVRKKHVLITETVHGFVCANSGVDVSNVNGGKHALLLPADPDRSAYNLHRALKKRLKLSIPVLITDTFGRPWREGLTEVAIGVAGMKAIHDDRGSRDPSGYVLRVSLEAVADELACAAGLVCGKLARTPACIIRGFPYRPARGTARELLRPAANDLFR